MTGDGPQTTIGRVVGAHGIRGGLKVLPLTDFPERFEAGSTVILRGKPHKIRRCTWHKGQARIEVDGIPDMTTAETYRDERVTVPAEDAPTLEEGTFLVSDLIGMTVVTRSGRLLGPLEEVVPSPAHDLLRIGEILIPLVREFVFEIDPRERRIVVDPIEGMLPGEEAVEVL